MNFIVKSIRVDMINPDSHFFTREDLMYRLEHQTGVFRNESIKKAFEDIDRKDFVPEDYEPEAYEDHALPIGYGQTISQPTVVAFMLELLDVCEGDKVLDVGSGSGWTTALLAKLVGKKGKVTGLEIIPELVGMGRENIKKYELSNADIKLAKDDGKIPVAGQFDRILVSASSEEIPQEFVERLVNGGVMVLPVREALCRVDKTSKGEIKEKKYPGFVFVPLIR